MTVPINEPTLPDVFVPTGFSAVLEEPGLATPGIHPYRVDLVGRSLDQPDRVQPRRLVLHPELASQIVGRLAGLIARQERQNTDWANLLSDDPTELTQQAAHLRDVLTVLASHAPTPLPTAQELAEGATTDKATAQRIHTARPGIPAHTAFNVLQALRAVRTVDHAPSPDRENRIPLDQLTAEELELLYDDLDRYAEVLSEMNATLIERSRRAEELDGARATIDHMTKAVSWISGHDRQGLDHLEEAQYEARAREAAVHQARQWAARARTAEAAVRHWTAFIERGMDTHMQFSLLHPDGTTEQLPCADWCYACRIEKAEAALLTAQADTLRTVANELEGIDFHPNAKATCRDLCRLLADRFRHKALERLDATRATMQPAPGETGLLCVCGDPVQLRDERDPSSWIHSPGSETRCLDARPRCPHCRMPHDLTPDSMGARACASILASLADAKRRHAEGDHSGCAAVDCETVRAQLDGARQEAGDA